MTFGQRVAAVAVLVGLGWGATTPEGQAAIAKARGGHHATAAPAAPSAATGARAGALALRQLGKPYVWASNGPRSFDCSGLVIFGAWKPAGADWPDATADQLGHHFPRVPVSRVRPGDLLVWDWQGDGRLDHVAVVVSGGRFVEALTPGVPVRVRKLSTAHATWAVRPDRTW